MKVSLTFILSVLIIFVSSCTTTAGNKKNFEDLNSVVKIISANQKEGNFYVEKKELLNALTSPQKNIDKQRH